MRPSVLATLCLCVLAGTAAAPNAQRAATSPRREAAVPFRPGETLTYDVSWSSMLVAGTAVVTVAEKRPSFNSTAYYIVAEGKPLPLLTRIYALYYKMETLVDSYTLLSQRTTLYSEEGARRRNTATRFDRGARHAFFEVFSDPGVKTILNVPGDVQDGLATVFALRTHALKRGEGWSYPVADNGALYTVAVQVGDLEPVKALGRPINAWKLQIRLTDAQQTVVWKNIAMWLSDDPRRLPVRMQADLPVGTFVLALREAR
jgi:hypothetical protein